MGGLNQISQAMAKAAGEDGARIHLKRGVKKVLVENGLAAGVELEDGSREKADYVVLNADFAHAMTRLVDPAHRRKYTDEKLREKLYSCSTFMLYLGVGRTDPDISHHSIMFSHDYRGNAGDIADRKVLSADPSFYVQNASAIAPSLAPAGKAALYVLVPVPNNTGRIDWAKEKGPFQEKILRLLETKGGYTDLIKNIEEEKVVTPADWENEKFVYNGATFNLGHNVGQMLIFRPHNEFEEFKNCYLVGGGTHPGSGLPTIYESGRISAGLIMRRDGLT
jgi:phytoene desaturase